MNGKDFIMLMDYMKAFNKPASPKREKKVKERNVFEQFQEMQQNLTLFQQFLKDQEKLNKKEEKKDKHEGMNIIHMTMLFALLSSCMGQVLLVGRFLGKW